MNDPPGGGPWLCKTCQAENFSLETSCVRCGSARTPDSAPPKARKPPALTLVEFEDDWMTGHWGVVMPEVFLAAAFCIGAVPWALMLFAQGRLLAGLTALATLAGVAALYAVARTLRSRWLVYLSVYACFAIPALVSLVQTHVYGVP
jgi:hypothetical protein